MTVSHHLSNLASINLFKKNFFSKPVNGYVLFSLVQLQIFSLIFFSQYSIFSLHGFFFFSLNEFNIVKSYYNMIKS